MDGELHLDKVLSAIERFNFSEYMLDMEANEIIQLNLFCNSKYIKVIVREGYSVGEIIDQLPAIEVYKIHTVSKYFSQMMASQWQK